MQRRKCSKCCTEVPWARAYPLAREGKEVKKKKTMKKRRKRRRRRRRPPREATKHQAPGRLQ
jgi:hypothetical protein